MHLALLLQMVGRGAKILVLKPAFVKRGYYFRPCVAFPLDGFTYDYELYNDFG